MLNSDHPRKSVAIYLPVTLGSALAGSLLLGGCHFGKRQSAPTYHPERGQSSVIPASANLIANPMLGNGSVLGGAISGHQASTSSTSYQVAPPASPASITAALTPPSVQSPKQMLSAWELLGGSHLRLLQSSALQSGSGSRAYADGGNQVLAVGGPNVATRQTLKQVANAYVDVRYHLERMQDLYDNLAIQEQAVAQAKQRRADGKAGRMDVLQSESAVGLTKSMMAPIRNELETSVARLTSLTGREVSPAMLKGIAHSPQLRFPDLDRRLPAAVLRQRHDVRQAEQQVVSMGVQSGIPEVTMMPHLSLQGELTAKNPTGGSQPSTLNESLDFNLGGAETWSFAAVEADSQNGVAGLPGGLPGGSGQAYSPIGQSMKGFQSTVYSAADHVESLLTQYHQALLDVEMLQQTQESASEAARLALQQFKVDRIEGSYVTNAQMRRVEAGQSLAQSRARLASLAIDLLVATGGECYPDADPSKLYGK
ncbi:TolC family protein [Planctomycetes bacterium K23_9]|uniref:Outer membrane efflux protein n=1 Tax=Stieleria marina TaxID=1930275 RepID=A0A517NW37_9BACT|nr:Outer membrane efflux protein [Planctomycetes bacterium K23_9]